ncbi:MAG: hypothetical protein RL760_224, partial [Candidatus Eisenbacteria bacterium]
MRLTNRDLAARLNVTPKHVARAAALRGIHRDAQGYYLVDDGQPSGVAVNEWREPTPISEAAGEQPHSQDGPGGAAKPYEPIFSAAQSRPTSARGFRLVAFASDIHIPDHDAFAVRAFLRWLSDARPDAVVLGGDVLELESCSGHGGNIHSAPLFTHEIECGNRFLDDLQAAAPSAEIHYLEGNHETRLKRKVDTHIPTLTGALSLPDLLRLSDRGISWLPYGKVLRLGQSKLGFTHGVRHNDHHAKAHLAIYGSSVVYGHTHRPQ